MPQSFTWRMSIFVSLTHSQSIDVPTIYTHRPLKISFAVIICVVLRIWKEWKKKGRKAKVAATETKEINKKITCERWKTRNFIFDFADFFPLSHSQSSRELLLLHHFSFLPSSLHIFIYILHDSINLLLSTTTMMRKENREREILSTKVFRLYLDAKIISRTVKKMSNIFML